MNWDTIEGRWKQLRGAIREKWGELTDSDFEVIAGKKDKLIGKIQERYGLSREEAERQVESWNPNLADTAASEPPPQRKAG